jgi:adenylyl-sulfate kinase
VGTGDLLGCRGVWYGPPSRGGAGWHCPLQQEQLVSEGFTLWFTGMSGAGKSTISTIVEQRLRQRGQRVELLDGDVVRTNLSKGLGFSKEDRDENIRRIGFVCQLLSRNGVAAIAAAISPYRDVRDEVRSRIGNFVEVYVECPLDTLVERDVKGLYRKAIAGEIKNFTGVSDPYEAPLNPEVVVLTHEETPDQSAGKILATLERLGYLPSTNGVTIGIVNGVAHGRHG